MNKLIKYIAILSVTFFVFSSCEKSSTEIDTPAEQSNQPSENLIAGNWEVKAFINNNEVFGPFEVEIEQTSPLNQDSINISDVNGVFWNFKVNAAMNLPKSTFQTKESVSESISHHIKIKIANGKITENDNIYFEIQFEDDVTPYENVYQLIGSRKSEK